MKNTIEILGARENNLKNIDLSFEKNKLIVITGVSGSGKALLLLIQFMLKVRGGIWRVFRLMHALLLEPRET